MKKNAFTLVELLVVISVISLLMAILVPTLARAKNCGKSVSCLSNLRQLGFAAQEYANENDGYYPIAYTNDPDPNDSIATSPCWDFTYTINWDTGEETLAPGILWQSATIEKVQQCPSFTGKANSFAKYTGYNYNTSFIGHGSNETTRLPAKVNYVRKPMKCALFGDGEYYDGANNFMRSPLKSSSDAFSFRSAGTQGFRHNNATNVIYCDGHGRPQKELYTDTMPSQKKLIEEYNQTAQVKVGFLSADNSAYEIK